MTAAEALTVAKEWITFEWFMVGETSVTAGLVLWFGLIAVSVWTGASIVERGVRRFASRQPNGAITASVAYAWARVLRYVVVVFGAIIGVNYLAVDLTSLAFIGGALGVGLGFGLQSIVANFVSGIVILLEGTLKIGDFVEFPDGVRGHVREVALRYTRIQTNDAVDVLVPNSDFITQRVTNWTFEEPTRRLHVPFAAAYGSDKEVVRDAAIRAAAKVTGTLLNEAFAPACWLVAFGDNGLHFQLVVWVKPEWVSQPGASEAEYCWALDDELRAAGIEIPFPQRDLRLRSGPLDVRIATGEPAEIGHPPQGVPQVQVAEAR